MKFENLYQNSLIIFALLVVFGLGAFLYFELFPEYKVYQDTYQELEKFRSTYTGEPPAPFSTGVQQIVIPKSDNGPEIVDRCISCHIAGNLPHFSPTKIAKNINGQTIYDEKGNPVLEKNEEYVFTKLDEEIQKLERSEIPSDHQKAQKLAALKTATIDGKKVDMTQVLKMHPLIGDEKTPFEFHPMSTYGCTSCHSGNGRALVAKRAHGPLYDEDYEKAYEIQKPEFLEKDSENDPSFSRMFNHKPAHDLVFQTTPLMVGPLMEARCAQCHQSTKENLKSVIGSVDLFALKKESQINHLKASIEDDYQALIDLNQLHKLFEEKGKDGTINFLSNQLKDSKLTAEQIDHSLAQLNFIKNTEEKHIEEEILNKAWNILGSKKLAQSFLTLKDVNETKVLEFLQNHSPEEISSYSVFAKKQSYEIAQQAVLRIDNTKNPLQAVSENKEFLTNIELPIDSLLKSYNRGKQLYISQACYPCHRISGYSRGNVGPDLTKIGLSYPWYVKESIVWPQADLVTSTMPNFKLDHEEVADLMAFLMAQRGESKTVSEVDHDIVLKEWEQGKKLPWEKPIPPSQIQNLQAGMTYYSTEGCAACHKLKGFESNIGFTVEEQKNLSQEKLIDEREWFYSLFPEQILGSQLVHVITQHKDEIDKRISKVRENSFLEHLNQEYPKLIEGYYSNFKFALRAKNSEYLKLLNAEHDDEKRSSIRKEWDDWKKRVWQVLMIYIQEYGLGRDIAPHLHWSGVFRDNAWLIGHFHNPGAYTPRSLMPMFPFDDSKFYALNHLLQVFGQKNRDELQAIWKIQGFNPALAYELQCSSCHGEQRRGNGVISEWIYPLPKNLRNPEFLQNLTKARAIDSITHGVKGTPMPPWGEAVDQQNPVLNHEQIEQLVEWLYQGIPKQRADTQTQIEKWDYNPSKVIKEMVHEKMLLEPQPVSLELENENSKEISYYFNEVENKDSADPFSYYIKKQFYTDENIQAGKEFFIVNCAHCHGKEGTGTGQRAATMVEAKPRMLTNMPWLKTRDDLRLLRSIKYGVPGTSMNPWGDFSSSKQRMQLVIFIRQLSKERAFRDQLEEILYETFDEKILKIEQVRIKEYEELASLESQLSKAEFLRQTLYDAVEKNKGSPEEAATAYAEELKILSKIQKRKELDQIFISMMENLKKQKDLFMQLGLILYSKVQNEPFTQNFLALLKTYPLEVTLSNKELKIYIDDEKAHKLNEHIKKIIGEIDASLKSLEQEKSIVSAKISFSQRIEKFNEIQQQEGGFINLRTKILSETTTAEKLIENLLIDFDKYENFNQTT